MVDKRKSDSILNQQFKKKKEDEEIVEEISEDESIESLDFIDDGEDESLDDSESVVGKPLSKISQDNEESDDEPNEKIKLKVNPKTKQDSLEQTIAPTSEEMQEYNETLQLFNSNLFRLSIIEFFKEIKVNYTKTTSLESSLHQLKSIIDNIKPFNVSSKNINNNIIKIYNSIQFEFKKPNNIELVGSYMIKSTIRSNPNVDITVEIPSSVLGEQDLYNYQYFTKRNMYLWALAQEIAKVDRFSDIEFQNMYGDTTKQMFIIRPKADPKTGAITKFQIRIFAKLGKSTLINPINLSPVSFNIEKLDKKKSSSTQDIVSTYHDTELNQSEVDQLDLKFNNSKKPFNNFKRSSFYNNSILEDMMYFEHLEFINEKITNAPILIDAIQLIKSWLLIKPIISINSFHMTMILMYLYEQGKINKSMSAYQIFRMLLVTCSNGFDQPMFFKVKEGSRVEQNSYFSSYRRLYPVSLIDQSGLLNITSRITCWAVQQLIQQSKRSLELLDSGDGFDEIFLQRSNISCQYDYILTIKLDGQENFLLPTNDLYCLKNFKIHQIYKLLKSTLGNRINNLTIIKQDDQEKEKDNNNIITVISFGIELDSNQWQRLIDKGPSGDHEDADLFRKKWGKLSQLRRFKDGSIVEAVVWNPPNGQRSLILEMISKHILNHSFGIKQENVHSLISLFDQPNNEEREIIKNNLISTKEKLIGFISSLQLPLKINGFYSISQALRYTSVDVIYDQSYNRNTPIKILMQFEHSPSWTNDARTIETLKTAFLIKIAREFQQQQFNSRMTEKYLDVCSDGFVFRFIPYYPRQLDYMGSEMIMERQQLVLYSNLLQHHNSIQTLSNNFNAYSQACCLAQRWLACHLFNGITPQIIELMMANIFLDTNSNGPVPTTPSLAFIRFLRLISTHQWSEQPLIIDFYNDLNVSDRQSILESFNNQKEAQNLPLFSIATNKDKFSTWFKSISSNDPLIRSRLVKCAQIDFDFINQNLFINIDMINNQLFKNPNQNLNFDLIINLNLNFINNRNQLFNQNQNQNQNSINNNQLLSILSQKFINFTQQKTKTKNNNNNELIYGLNLVDKFVENLDSRFQGYCKFYYDRLGGSTIYVLLDHRTFTPLAFKPSRALFSMPIDSVGGNKNIIPNVYAIIAEMSDIGGKIINNIQIEKNSKTMEKYN